MRTVSVKEAASALGISPRAIIYRLEKGDLKGNRVPNQYGVQEWRIFPTKEIAQKLKGDATDTAESSSEEMDFSPDDVQDVEAETVNVEPAKSDDVHEGSAMTEREKLRLLAEEMIKPLVETIREQERQIEEQSKQLKLLPDLEKRAEEERKEMEIKSLEAEALKKQITALEGQLNERVPAEKDKELEAEKAAKEAEIEKIKGELEVERKVKEEELSVLKEKLAIFDEYKRSAEEAQKKVEEMRKLQEEKDAQTTAIQEQLSTITERLEKAEQPWWKKWFLPREV